MRKLLFFILVIAMSTIQLSADIGLDGKQRSKHWPSPFLIDSKIPDHVAKAEIDEMLSSVIGSNATASSVELKDGLNRLRELHYRMSAAKANEKYLMKLNYFLVKQFIFVLQSKENVDSLEMVNQFLNLEAWFFRNTSLAKKLIKGFESGLSQIRSQIKNYALEEYRARRLALALEQLHEDYSGSLSQSTSKVRGVQGQCADQNFYRSDCYECASWAVARALDSEFQQSDPWHVGNVNQRLNSPAYAKQFHNGWIEEQDRNMFRLTQIFSARDQSVNERQKGMQTAMEAPTGSILIWSVCGSHPAGHIAIKTSDSTAASSFSAPIQQTCGNPSAQIVGVYTPVDNRKVIDAVNYKFEVESEDDHERNDETELLSEPDLRTDKGLSELFFGGISF